MSLDDDAKTAIVSLTPIKLADVATATLPAPPFVIERLIPRRVVTLLGGHGGAGKSILGLTLCAHVAAGAHAWAGYRLEDGHALYVSLEDPADVVRYRLRHIAEAYGLDMDKIARRLIAVDGTNGDPVLAFEQSDMGVRRLLFSSTMEEIEERAAGARLVVIDNASDAYDGNENDRRMVRAFVRRLAGIARQEDAGLILLAHIDKAAARYGSNGNTFSGSTAWHNSARSRLALVEDNGTITLVPEKLNLGKPAAPIALQWSENGVLLPVARTTADAGTGDAEHVLAAMRAARAADVDVGSARTGPATAQTVLATFDELPAHLRGTRGRAAFWSAIGKLQGAGKVVAQEIVTAQRKRKKVLSLTDCASSACANSPDEGVRANPPHPYALNSAHEGAQVCVGLRQFDDSEPAQTGAAAYLMAKGGEL